MLIMRKLEVQGKTRKLSELDDTEKMGQLPDQTVVLKQLGRKNTKVVGMQIMWLEKGKRKRVQKPKRERGKVECTGNCWTEVEKEDSERGNEKKLKCERKREWTDEMENCLWLEIEEIRWQVQDIQGIGLELMRGSPPVRIDSLILLIPIYSNISHCGRTRIRHIITHTSRSIDMRIP